MALRVASQMKKYGEWEIIKPLGSGGQSEVFLVRSPARVSVRKKNISEIFSKLSAATSSVSALALKEEDVPEFAGAIAEYTRPDLPSELGALKVFKLRTDGNADAEKQSLQRLLSEIAVLKKQIPGMLKLLDSNEKDRWIITEYYPDGSMERNLFLYKGKAALALKAFRSLVETVAELHKDGIVHRDIKPANVFFEENDQLILGDFGIVFLPDRTRVTVTDEKVGPRDYMPQWADLGSRLEDVPSNFDVYMLGKLLWCMVAGRLKLPREYHRREAFDLTRMFPNDPAMEVINGLLDDCVVENPERCIPSAAVLLHRIDHALTVIHQPIPMLNPQTGLPQLPCRMCGRGIYLARQTLSVPTALGGTMLLRVFTCSVCTHYEFFTSGHPEEAAARNWRPWG